MIDSIQINAFKSFRSCKVNLGRLTVLAGLNNSGKSSLIQAIRMCLAARDVSNPYIDGYGGYSELKSRSSAIDEVMSISLEIKGNKTVLNLFESKHEIVHSEMLPLAQFVCADRYGPRVQLPAMREDIAAMSVGVHGEYTAHYASILERMIVAEPLRYTDVVANTLKHQLTRWMSEISPGIKLDFDVLKKYDASQLQVDDARPTNSGFGISYVMPIVLCLLTMSGTMGEDDSDWRVRSWFTSLQQQGGLLLIENPEAHLHPRGQTCLGQLAALASACGLQVIVETHSDHFIDGIRIAVKHTDFVEHSDIAIKYFAKNVDEVTEIEEIEVLPDGKLSKWPNGFFDQMSINLRKLAQKNEKG
ncbi:DUF3696 domain-containing protein [Alcaligenes faecalis]|uniref:AAA family ATPase n=1 Tax=Alcaligenes faecalis TaxID=511 RepID=UPI0010CA32CE|nr:DUF3696 domain-containing protein [Alcaligenes faecalis]QCP80910.1 DUF3696 domain-containing protein [Alcaligenes faecalis]